MDLSVQHGKYRVFCVPKYCSHVPDVFIANPDPHVDKSVKLRDALKTRQAEVKADIIFGRWYEI